MKNGKVASSLIITILLAAVCLAPLATLIAKADGQTINSPPNITVNNVTTSQSFIEEGFQTNISAIVENLGASTATFNLTFYANDISLNTQEITLPGQSSTTASFQWDTTDFAFGNWSLSACAWNISDPSSTVYSNCTSTNGNVLVTFPGDLTGHSQVDSDDFFAFTDEYINYNSPATYAQCNPAADFDHDGKITANDFFSFMSAYIAYWTGPTPFLNKGLTLTMNLNQTTTTYTQGELVNFTLSINNVSNRTITFYNSYNLFDFIVYNETAILYRNSLNMLMVPQWIQLVSLAPGENLTKSMDWDQSCNINIKLSSGALSPIFLAQPGTYHIMGQALGMQTLPQQITIIPTQ